MKKLLIVVMAFYAMNARAQKVDESKNFVYLYSDSVIYAKKVMLRPDVLDSWSLRVDSRRFPTEKVKFINNEHGFFGNTKRLTLGRTTGFSERIIEGRINLFQQRSYDPFSYDHGYGYGYGYGYGVSNRRSPAVDVRMYYNKGYGDLKKVNYYNLNQDMADRPESIDLLKNYRKKMTTAKILYTAAGASIIGGFISFLANSGGSKKLPDRGDFMNHTPGSSFKHQNFTPSFVLLGLGAGFALGGAAVQTSGSRQMERAIENYNQ